uniref:FBA_2 domain-containing protein n=1 Tax=Caenorhabditis tropicalis TaxID=1561998 RepID=A0A1I7T4P5_9PELO
MFPLFLLPLLCIQEVTDLWESVDLYKFSTLSKKAKRISKKRKANPYKVILDVGSHTLTLEKNGLRDYVWTFESEEIDLFLYLQANQHFMDVFNCPLGITIDLEPPLTDDQLIMMIDWLNNMKNDIEWVEIQYAIWPMFDIFMNRFKRSVDMFTMHQHMYSSFVYKSPCFEIKQILDSDFSGWFGREFIMNMDPEQILANEIDLSGADLNVFLRSWQEGKTNRGLRVCKLSLNRYFNIREVLKGCGAKMMDPRTTKLYFRSVDGLLHHDIWIYGGFYIRRNDGRLAVIQTYLFQSFKENEDTHWKHIPSFLEARDMWNSENSTGMHDYEFHVYIF